MDRLQNLGVQHAPTTHVDLLPETSARHRAVWRTLLPVLGYFAGSCLLNWPLLRHAGSAVTGGGDSALFTWWLQWTPYALEHGHSPFVSTWINAPQGVNGMWNTSVTGLAILMWPVTAAFGPVVSDNLLVLSAPALSAWAALVAARTLHLRLRSAVLVGYLYGFSTYEIAHNEVNHLNLSLALFPPLLLAVLYRVVIGAISARRAGLLIGGLVVAQALIGEEMLATSVVFSVLGGYFVARGRPHAVVVPVAKRLFAAAGWALSVAVPLLTPLLYIQFFGPSHLTSGVAVPPYSSDLLSTVVPSYQSWVHVLLPRLVVPHIQRFRTESNCYIGLPAVILLTASRRRLRASQLGWCWPLLVVGLVLSLGWGLVIAEHDLMLPMPGQLIARLPVASSIILTRFSLYFVLFAALLTAEAWQTATAPVVRRWTAGLLVLTVLAVLPSPPTLTGRSQQPPALARGKTVPGLPEGATIATLPWPSGLNADAMRVQSVNGMHFRLMGAWGIVAGRDGAGRYGSETQVFNYVEQVLWSGAAEPAPGSDLEQQCVAELTLWGKSASALVILPEAQSPLLIDYLDRLLKEHPQPVGGVYVFNLPGH